MSVISDAASHCAPVELERLDGEVVVVTLSRHAERNALSRDVLEALFEALEVAATGARAMVLTGGPDVFCAGGDLGFLHRALAAGNHAEVRETWFLLVDVVRRLRALPMPTIAAVERPRGRRRPRARIRRRDQHRRSPTQLHSRLPRGRRLAGRRG